VWFYSDEVSNPILPSARRRRDDRGTYIGTYFFLSASQFPECREVLPLEKQVCTPSN